MADTVRPTKKQKELLTFISDFINEHGYSPSYREIMAGLNYNSVATVALHVNNLIKRGHLIKRENSARSLEVVNNTSQSPAGGDEVKPGQEKWLVEKIEAFFHGLEQEAKVAESQIDQLYVMVAALKVLGLEAAAQAFVPRLSALKERVQ